MWDVRTYLKAYKKFGKWNSYSSLMMTQKQNLKFVTNLPPFFQGNARHKLFYTVIFLQNIDMVNHLFVFI